MDDLRDLCGIDLASHAEALDAGGDGLGRVLRRRGDLEEVGLTLLDVEEQEVGERPPDVNAQLVRHVASVRRRHRAAISGSDG